MEKIIESSQSSGTVSRDELSLRISVTDRCQNRCLYCTPPDGVKMFAHDDILRYEEILAFVKIVSQSFRLSKVHLTGGEPLLRRGLAELVKMLAEAGIEDIALTTNGLALAKLATELKLAGLKRTNVSLDSLDPETYSKLTRNSGTPDEIINGIDAALAAGLTVKLNAIMIRNLNDHEAPNLVKFALDRGLIIRFIELMPFGPAADEHQKLFVPAEETLNQIKNDANLNCTRLSPIDRQLGSSSRLFEIHTASGLAGKVGVISSTTHPFCGGCKRLRLSACGELIGCLARSDDKTSIRELLRAEQIDAAKIISTIEKVLANKRTDKNFNKSHNMQQVGG